MSMQLGKSDNKEKIRVNASGTSLGPIDRFKYIINIFRILLHCAQKLHFL